MDYNHKYGLPQLVIDLLRTKDSEKGQKMTFKIVSCETEYTQLVLTWRPAKNRHDPAILTGSYNSGHVKPGYRKKSPCELKRDKRRKEQYLSEKGKQQRKDDTRTVSNVTKHESVEIQCNIVNEAVRPIVTCDMVDIDGPKVAGVVTRSMAKGDSDPEVPRDYQEDSGSADILSPVSVVTSQGDKDSPLPHSVISADCESPMDVSHTQGLSLPSTSITGDFTNCDIVKSFTSADTDSMVDSTSSDSDDPDPSCNNKYCSYGEPGGDVNQTYYICKKCDYTICTECFLNRRHKRHVEWFEFKY